MHRLRHPGRGSVTACQSTMKPEAALSHSHSYSSTANTPVNTGGASLCLSMLVGQSGLQVHMFTTFGSFFLLRSVLSFGGV